MGDKLHDEVRELSTQLYTSQEQKTMLVERIDEAFKKLDLSEQQRDNLKVYVTTPVRSCMYILCM